MQMHLCLIVKESLPQFFKQHGVPSVDIVRMTLSLGTWLYLAFTLIAMMMASVHVPEVP